MSPEQKIEIQIHTHILMKTAEHEITNKNISKIQRTKTDYLQRNDNQMGTQFSKIISKRGRILSLNYGRQNSQLRISTQLSY